jgi:hypothetical protein
LSEGSESCEFQKMTSWLEIDIEPAQRISESYVNSLPMMVMNTVNTVGTEMAMSARPIE